MVNLLAAGESDVEFCSYLNDKDVVIDATSGMIDAYANMQTKVDALDETIPYATDEETADFLEHGSDDIVVCNENNIMKVMLHQPCQDGYATGLIDGKSVVNESLLHVSEWKANGGKIDENAVQKMKDTYKSQLRPNKETGLTSVVFNDKYAVSVLNPDTGSRKHTVDEFKSMVDKVKNKEACDKAIKSVGKREMPNTNIENATVSKEAVAELN